MVGNYSSVKAIPCCIVHCLQTAITHPLLYNKAIQDTKLCELFFTHSYMAVCLLNLHSKCYAYKLELTILR